MKAVHTVPSKIARGRAIASPLRSTAEKCLGFARKGGAAVLAALLVLVPITGAAAPLNLANSPLFLATSVEPNITFVNDDSGSMDWGIMVVQGGEGTMILDGRQFSGDRRQRYVHVFCMSDNNDCTLDGDKWDNSSEWDRHEIVPSVAALLAHSKHGADEYGVWRARFSGFNAMYYNPEVTYTPWAGVNEVGAPYGNVDPTEAPLDPYLDEDNDDYREADLENDFEWISDDVPRPFESGSDDIRVQNYYPARYYLWTDTNTNGLVDATDARTLVEIRSSNEPYVHTSGDRADCGNALACTYAEEIQNFANWFSYYHRREHAAKNAIGKFSAAANGVRLAYGTLHDNNSNIIDIASMNPDPASGNKRALLDGLYRTQSTGGTPLRRTLAEAGDYYECSVGSSLWSGCPILPAASGGACQQNFAVLMTDGFWNGNNPTVGNTDDDGNSANTAGNTTFDGDPYWDTFSNTLADVAMHYYERDLDTVLANQVPVTPGIDDADHQHMVTYTVAFGLEGTLDPFDTKTPGDASDTDPTDPSFVGWPSPVRNTTTTLDDMWHAAYNGRGQYLSAKDPTGLSTALSDAISSIAERTGAAASAAVNSRTLSTTTRIFQGRFTSGEWSGELRAIPISVTGAVGAEVWNAKDELISQSASGGWNSNRQILSWDGTSGIAFRWGSLNPGQQTALNTDPGTGSADGEGAARLDYLRGDHSNEGGLGNNYRVRKNGFVLGDITQSSPVYVGAPPFLPDLESTPHSSYRAANSSRREMLYVGANDGMLHGFDSNTGQEKIAYVPDMVFSNLNRLTNPSYAHRYYVNGSPTAGDVFFGGAWHTMVVGGLGHGGKGYFALDVSDPDGSNNPALAFNETNAGNIAQWEFTDAATPDDMGFSYNKPTIAKMHDGSWAAIFGNGYNSVNENAVLYIIDIETAAIIKKFDLGGNPANGLFTPAVIDSDGDFIADYIYAGDLKGNMWKIDVTATNSNSWKVFYRTGGTDKPLFQARDGGGSIQPITERPEIGLHPDGEDGFMVYFGTGKYLEDGDKTPKATPVHTFYGIWDENPTSGNLGGGKSAAVLRNDLLAQSLSNALVGSVPVREVTDNAIRWRPDATTPDHLGWRVDLDLVTGEMSVSNPVLVGGELPRIIFTTLIPETAASCAFGGTSWLMELNPINGGRFPEAVFDINGDGVFDDKDLIGGTGGIPPSGVNPNIGILPEPVVIQDTANNKIIKGLSGSTGAIQTNAQKGSGGKQGRQGWRQLR